MSDTHTPHRRRLPIARHIGMLSVSWLAAALTFAIAQSVLWPPGATGWALAPRALISLVLTTSLVYRPLMMWLQRRGDGATPDGKTASVSFVLLGLATYPLPLVIAFPGYYALVVFIPSRAILPFIMASAAAGMVYGIGFATLKSTGLTGE